MKQVLPPTFFIGAAVISVVVHFSLPGIVFVHYPVSLLGVIMIVIGGVLNIWADQIFKKVKTTVKPHDKPSALIVEGPFRMFRHPMYFGMLIILLGISFICGSVMSLIGPIGFWIVIRIRFIPAEEHAMFDAFGSEYGHYKRRVLAWM
jgi:protein-S-isoprenylcysteine O-methyltransferase Ste14